MERERLASAQRTDEMRSANKSLLESSIHHRQEQKILFGLPCKQALSNGIQAQCWGHVQWRSHLIGHVDELNTSGVAGPTEPGGTFFRSRANVAIQSSPKVTVRLLRSMVLSEAMTFGCCLTKATMTSRSFAFWCCGGRAADAGEASAARSSNQGTWFME